MLELGVLGRSVFQMRFQCGNDQYCMVISIYSNKICGTLGYEYSVKNFNSNKVYELEKLGSFEMEGTTRNNIGLVMIEILKQSADAIMNHDLPLDLDDEKVRGFYIPLFSKFIKEKREG